jgi:hypothetical protein
MLARRLTTILPAITLAEALETARIHRVSGCTGRTALVTTRPCRASHHQVKQRECVVRILPYRLPSKSPWLNPIEPKWILAKRAVMEPERKLPAQELAERVCAYYGCKGCLRLHLKHAVNLRQRSRMIGEHCSEFGGFGLSSASNAPLSQERRGTPR